MRTSFFLLLFLASINLYGQTLVKKFTWKSNSITESKIEWVDLNNDSLLDVLVLAQSSNHRLQVSIYKNNLAGFSLVNNQELDLAINSYSIVDVNNDNKIDIVVNGFQTTQQTKLLTNQSNFQFIASSNASITPLKITQQAWVDFNLDGKMDWVVGGADFLKVFQATATGYVLKLDSTDIKISSILPLDVSKDGKMDLIISGSKLGKEFMVMLQNMGGFKFEYFPIIFGIEGNLETGDFNYDGFFDVVVSGNNQIKYFRNNSTRLTATDSVFGFGKGELRVANFNSDSLVELSFNGRTGGGARTNFILSGAGTSTHLDSAQLVTQRWGDYDRDGDLDLLQVRDSAGYQVFQLLENTTTRANKRPPAPENYFVVSVLNKTIIYWSLVALDDHTPIKSITYDLQLVSGDKTIINPSFDLTTKQRLTPSHGNQSTRNAIIVRNLAVGFGTYVQSVDNSFVGSNKVLVCNDGVGSGFPACQETVVETRQLCRGSIEKIVTSEPAHWFSFRKGYLGLQFQTVPPGLTFLADQPDTLVSVITQNGAQCAKVHAYIININEPQKRESANRFVCPNSTIKLGVAPGWQTVNWSFQNSTASTDSITFTIRKPTTVNVEASNGSCVYKKEFTLKISQLDLKIENKHFIINQGESAQLSASGAAKYLWLPPTGLSNNQSPNPTASPTKSFIYQLTAFDSIGCSKKDTVKVEVIGTAFIPTLFTPNGDGKNDELKVLGISGAVDFEFTIYNREGNVVYESSNWQQASNVGWNGQKSGNLQPGGLYYWKIVGKQTDGQPLLLNGKSNGSVLLIR